jgi:hypothetical protein
VLGDFLLHHHFFNDPRLFPDDRLFDGLGQLKDLLRRRGKTAAVAG